ncbi:hypothetical protein BJX68DRAFT_57883 [Aspergillus pseudodeflectus]|uniref:Uncharacterized protein n=1 Tax=Aspergillus pseudodeflectus TaxID=176178 RepID=A0ABR4KKE2_9EURO
MNAALPIRQGFSHQATQLLSLCANPECQRMTYTLSGPNRPAELSPSDIRGHLYIGDPLGPYCCKRCCDYKRHRGELPDRDAIARTRGASNAGAVAKG